MIGFSIRTLARRTTSRDGRERRDTRNQNLHVAPVTLSVPVARLRAQANLLNILLPSYITTIYRATTLTGAAHSLRRNPHTHNWSVSPAMLRGDTQDRLIGWCRQALRFVLPVECIACGHSLSTDPVPFFCTACWQNIRPLQQPACARCDRPFVSLAATAYTPNHQCQDCQRRSPDFQRAWTLFPYLPPLREAICSFKYRGKHTLAKPLARLMISALPREIDVDIIIPVPLHPTRLRMREFNQSLLVADQLGRHMARPVSTTHLVRITATDPQTTLTRQARLRNLRKAFEVHRPQDLTDKRILLVDDVFTTGTTLNECAKTLRKAGSGPVFALTLARTVDTELVPDRLLAEQATSPLTSIGI